MFLHFYTYVSFCSQGGWLPSMHHRSHDQGVCIWGVCIRGVGRPPRYYGIRSTSGKYVSYWNAFLFFRVISFWNSILIPKFKPKSHTLSHPWILISTAQLCLQTTVLKVEKEMRYVPVIEAVIVRSWGKRLCNLCRRHGFISRASRLAWFRSLLKQSPLSEIERCVWGGGLFLRRRDGLTSRTSRKDVHLCEPVNLPREVSKH